MTQIPDHYGTWPLDQLADHIEQTFHRYIRTAVPTIRERLHSLCETSREQYPGLAEAERLFITATNELERHLLGEEVELFPAIQFFTGRTTDDPARITPEQIKESVRHFEREHDAETAFFNRISRLLSNYAAPVDADPRMVETMALLKEFDLKLRRHIQLENEALFPTAIEIAEHFAKHE